MYLSLNIYKCKHSFLRGESLWFSESLEFNGCCKCQVPLETKCSKKLNLEDVLYLYSWKCRMECLFPPFFFFSSMFFLFKKQNTLLNDNCHDWWLVDLWRGSLQFSQVLSTVQFLRKLQAAASLAQPKPSVVGLSLAVTVSLVLPTHCILCFSPQISQCVGPDEGFSVNIWRHKYGWDCSKSLETFKRAFALKYMKFQ